LFGGPNKTEGAVYVYEKGILQATLVGNANQYLARAVALAADGLTLAVGGSDANLVKVYTKQAAGTWSHSKTLGTIGVAVALNAKGTVLAFGATDATRQGSAYVYNLLTGFISKVGSGHAVNDDFGWNVALDAAGTTVAVAAPQLNQSAADGYVRVYTTGDAVGTWTQLGQDLRGPSKGPAVGGDNWGLNVSLSADGLCLAVAPRNAGDPSHGIASDPVQTYQLDATRRVWVPDVPVANPDWPARWVQLSADGLTLAFGGLDRKVFGRTSRGSAWVPVQCPAYSKSRTVALAGSGRVLATSSLEADYSGRVELLQTAAAWAPFGPVQLT
jgi:hypothetical protein